MKIYKICNAPVIKTTCQFLAEGLKKDYAFRVGIPTDVVDLKAANTVHYVKSLLYKIGSFFKKKKMSPTQRMQLPISTQFSQLPPSPKLSNLAKELERSYRNRVGHVNNQQV